MFDVLDCILGDDQTHVASNIFALVMHVREISELLLNTNQSHDLVESLTLAFLEDVG